MFQKNSLLGKTSLIIFILKSLSSITTTIFSLIPNVWIPNLVLKKISNNRLKSVIATKKEQIKAAKREQEAAILNLELKRTLKEYLRRNEVKEYIRLCTHNTYIKI